MIKRILSRLLVLAVVLFGVTLLTFFYTSLSTVDAAQALAVRRFTRPTAEQVTQVRHELGLDQPLAKQYVAWLSKAVSGEFGNSYNTGKPIINELSASLQPTLKLASMALLFTALLSIPLGVWSASGKGGIADKSIYLFGIVCMSVPNYWIGFMLMLAFAVNIPLFSIMGADDLKDFILPALAVAIPTSAANIRVFRSSLLDGYNSDFVMYARARGISEIKIAGMVSRYALPPLVTLLGQSFGFTIAGSAMIEFVFSIPGIGSMLVTALGSRDTVTINACVLVIAVIFVAVNFLAEVINAVLDPKKHTKERVYDT
ncbi:ABC transporter permease [Ruminococcus sp.]|uniref:ABC transporter permease n=1 Tax=Ruminococcus sp. TaxID=41978 RepID=UPI001B052426|nr:ABC transporter permease [Ruminococcus sp.]MBO5559456.1 ABC transporter permease [Ruminococcus sp.]